MPFPPVSERLPHHRWSLALWAVAALASSSASAQQVCPAAPSRSLRMMTYNAFMTVFPADNSSNFGMSHEARATKIALRILKDDPDIVALQEVDDEDAKSELVRMLARNGPYKSFVKKADLVNPLNDSGLMLFSKLPFGRPDTLIINGTILGLNAGHCEGEIDGHEFTNCNELLYGASQSNGSDWWQNKGVVVVRAGNACFGGEPINVAFTHTQSKGSTTDDDCAYGEDVADLLSQFGSIKGLLEASFSSTSLRTQPTFVLGDLNVDGNQKGANAVTSRDRKFVLDSCLTSSRNEWELYFNSADPVSPIAEDTSKGFFACRGNQSTTHPCNYVNASSPGTLLIDSWAYQTSRLDPGQTQSGETGGNLVFPDVNKGDRDDFVLHNDPRSAKTSAKLLCMQHVRRGFAFGGNDLSDHLSVTADFNIPAPRCSMRPRQPGDSHLDVGDDADPLGPQPVTIASNTAIGSLGPDGGTSLFVDAFFDGTTEVPAVTTIANPGNMQWYVIDAAGPMRITTAGGVAFEVFQGADLSNRITGGSTECTPFVGSATGGPQTMQSCTFTLPLPPYYVRVFGATNADPDRPNRQTIGPYTVRFHKLDCTSLADACPLEPATPFPASFPNTPILPGPDALFFSFLSDQAHPTDTFPAVDFRLQHQFASKFDSGGAYIDPLLPTLNNRLGAVLIGASGGFGSQNPAPKFPPDPTVTWANFTDASNTAWLVRDLSAAKGTLIGAPTGPEKYFFKVVRNPGYALTASPILVSFTTDLTYLRPRSLQCWEERTDVGDDDLASAWKIGSKFDALRQLGAVNGNFEEWEDGDFMPEAGTQNTAHSPFPFELDVSFVGESSQGEAVEPSMLEDFIDGDNYLMCSVDHGGSCWPVFKEPEPIHALPKTQPDPATTTQAATPYMYRDENGDDNWDYWYQLDFTLRHQRPACRGTTGAQSDCPALGTACSSSIPALSSQNHAPRCVCTADIGCPTGQTCNLTSGSCF